MGFWAIVLGVCTVVGTIVAVATYFDNSSKRIQTSIRNDAVERDREASARRQAARKKRLDRAKEITGRLSAIGNECTSIDRELQERYDSFNPKHLFGSRDWYKKTEDRMISLVAQARKLEDELDEIRQWHVRDGDEWPSSMDFQVSDQLRYALDVVRNMGRR